MLNETAQSDLGSIHQNEFKLNAANYTLIMVKNIVTFMEPHPSTNKTTLVELEGNDKEYTITYRNNSAVIVETSTDQLRKERVIRSFKVDSESIHEGILILNRHQAHKLARDIADAFQKTFEP